MDCRLNAPVPLEIVPSLIKLVVQINEPWSEIRLWFTKELSAKVPCTLPGMTLAPPVKVLCPFQVKFDAAVAGLNAVAIAFPAVPAVSAVTVNAWLTREPALA